MDPPRSLAKRPTFREGLRIPWVWAAALMPLALATLGLVAAFLDKEVEWAVLLLLVGNPALLLYLMLCGQWWARVVLTLLYAAIAFFVLVVQLPGTMLGGWWSSAEFWIYLALGLILMSIAMGLLISERVDEYVGRYALLRGPSWSDVARRDGHPHYSSAHRVAQYRVDDFDRRARLGRWSSMTARVAVIIGWAAIAAAIFLIWKGAAEHGRGVSEFQDVGTAVAEAGATMPGIPGMVAGATLGLAFSFLTLFAVVIYPIAVMMTLVAAYAVQFVLPFLLALPLALPVVLGWRGPAVILVLRPFNRARVTSGLRILLTREIAPLGHCYTLADAHVRVPLSVRIPLMLG